MAKRDTSYTVEWAALRLTLTEQDLITIGDAINSAPTTAVQAAIYVLDVIDDLMRHRV